MCPRGVSLGFPAEMAKVPPTMNRQQPACLLRVQLPL